MRTKKAKHVLTSWNINGNDYPVKIYYEWRSSRRVSIGKNAINVRLPWATKSLELSQHDQWAKDWLTQLHIKSPSSFDHFIAISYEQGDLINTTKKTYTLDIVEENRKSGSAKLKEEVIGIKLPIELPFEQQNKMIHTLIGRILAQDNQPWVEEKTRWLNQHYFQKPITTVKLKNNRTNWGSCSSSGNINISVRLLFAPEEVQDYVLIHELAHLIEMNHTSRFWKLVEDIMPDYKQKERWLKKNSHLCNF